MELPKVEQTVTRTTATVPDGGSVRLGGHTGAGASTVTSPGGVGRGMSYGAGQTTASATVIELE